MKANIKLTNGKATIKFYLVFGIVVFVLRAFYAGPVISQANHKSTFKMTSDTSVAIEIYTRLNNNNKNELGLYYPASVKRFYSSRYFQPVWVKEQPDHKQTWDAMLLLDCVLQYGLAHADYHPGDLNYDQLHIMLDHPDKVSAELKAKYDIMLTDALIAFMNNLHYGKLNPEYAADKIDKGEATTFHAETVLMNAVQQKNFADVLLSVQPKSKQYAALQDRMRILKGQYQEDCYTVPESEVRKIAINMERLRWASIDEDTYIQVNIPSYTLKFYRPDTVYQFKVVVGKPSSPTPELHSYIMYLTTTPEWKIPQKIFINEILPKALKDPAYLDNNHFSIYNKQGEYVATDKIKLSQIRRNPANYNARQSAGCDNSLGSIVFRFPNVYDIYLHDTPEQQLFKKEERAFSHSCIRVEHVQQIAALLLKSAQSGNKIAVMNQALKAHLTKNISFIKPVPIKIIYLTCEMSEGVLITYNDIYNLDSSLELALYGNDVTTSKK